MGPCARLDADSVFGEFLSKVLHECDWNGFFHGLINQVRHWHACLDR